MNSCKHDEAANSLPLPGTGKDHAEHEGSNAHPLNDHVHGWVITRAAGLSTGRRGAGMVTGLRWLCNPPISYRGALVGVGNSFFRRR